MSSNILEQIQATFLNIKFVNTIYINVFSEVAMPIMIVAFLPFIVCQDAKIAPYLTSMNKTFILKFWAYLSHSFNV